MVASRGQGTRLAGSAPAECRRLLLGERGDAGSEIVGVPAGGNALRFELHLCLQALPRRLLEQALGTYERLGMERYARDVRILLAAPRPAAPDTAYPGRLTPREVDVVRLIAAGRSNREIAAALVLSERTVERHIANAYRKLGVSSRVDAAAWSIRYGLGPRR